MPTPCLWTPNTPRATLFISFLNNIGVLSAGAGFKRGAPAPWVRISDTVRNLYYPKPKLRNSESQYRPKPRRPGPTTQSGRVPTPCLWMPNTPRATLFISFLSKIGVLSAGAGFKRAEQFEAHSQVADAALCLCLSPGNDGVHMVHPLAWPTQLPGSPASPQRAGRWPPWTPEKGR